MWQLRICFLYYSFEDCWIQNTSYSLVYSAFIFISSCMQTSWWLKYTWKYFQASFQKMSINQFGLQFLKDSISPTVPPTPSPLLIFPNFTVEGLIHINEWWTQIENLHLLQMIQYPNGLTNKQNNQSRQMGPWKGVDDALAFWSKFTLHLFEIWPIRPRH